MELRDALSQIDEIRLRMARSEVFRGYRAGPVGVTGVLALVAAGIQVLFLPEPTRQIGPYLGLWLGAAALSGLVAGTGMVLAGSVASSWRRRITRQAVEQFVPSLVVGGLLTAVLAATAPDVVWMLPGLWQILFGLGVFASIRHLPRAMVAVAAWYLVAGLTCLVVARGHAALASWAMGVPFGVGQLLCAAILYWTLERPDAEA
jgi:hypothetical protein